MGVGFAGAGQVLFENLLVRRVQAILLHVDHVQIAMKPVRLPPSAANHQRRVRPRRDAHQDALVRAVDLLNALAAQVQLELLVDDFGGQNESDLSQFGELVLELDRIDRLPAHALRRPRHTVFGRSVHNLDFIGSAQKRLRNGLLHGPSENPLDLLLPLFDELEVDRRDHRDAGFQQFLDVLPALGVLAPRRVLVGQTVDQTHARAAPQHGRHVDRRTAQARRCRNLFETAQQLPNLSRRGGLQRSDHDILSAHLAAAPFVQHAKGLPNAGCVPQKNLQLASLAVAFFRFDLPE